MQLLTVKKIRVRISFWQVCADKVFDFCSAFLSIKYLKYLYKQRFYKKEEEEVELV